jgi:DNA-directed RNA polymerase subunit RPC12/RpoP
MAKERVRCPKCSFRIRGKKHDEGSHHQTKRPELKIKKSGTNKNEKY